MPDTDGTKASSADAGAPKTAEAGATTPAEAPLVTPPSTPVGGQLDKAQREALRRRLRERFH